MTKVYSPRQVERILEHARGYLILDLPGLALEELQHIKYEQHARHDFHQLMAAAHRELKQYPESALHYRIVLQHEPHQLDALLGVAWCEKRMGKLEISIECMLEACEHHPEESISVYNLACYYALNHQEDEALSWLRKAFILDAKYVSLVSAETDFDSLRSSYEFQELISEFQRKI